MGWNGSTLKGRNPATKTLKGISSKRIKFSRILIAILLVATLGCVAFVLFCKPEPKEPDGAEKIHVRNRKMRIADVTAHVSTNTFPLGNSKNIKNSQDTGEKHWRMEDNIVRKHPNGDYVIRDSKGRNVLIISKESRRIPGEKPLMFTNRFERVLMQFAIPGQDIPPLPDVWTEEDVEEALSRPVNIDMNNDDELTIQRKEGVIMLKEEFAKAREKGMTSTEFVRELAHRQAMEADLVNQTRTQVMQHIIDGDLEMARALQKKFNEHLSSKGLPPLRFPKEVIGDDKPATTADEDSK